MGLNTFLFLNDQHAIQNIFFCVPLMKKSGLEHDGEKIMTKCLFKICFIHQIIFNITNLRKTTRTKKVL